MVRPELLMVDTLIKMRSTDTLYYEMPRAVDTASQCNDAKLESPTLDTMIWRYRKHTSHPREIWKSDWH